MPRQAAGHRILAEMGEEPDQEDLGSYADDVPTS